MNDASGDGMHGMRVKGAVILSIGMVSAAVILGAFFYAARATEDTIQVVGMASQPFEADQVKWTLGISRTASTRELRGGYEAVSEDVRRVLEGMARAGIPADAVTLQPVTTNPVYGPNGITDYQISQSLFLVSENLEAVEDLALNPAGLLGEDVLLQNSRLEYFYSGLAEVKRSLLAAATSDARQRADEIAGAAGSRVAGIRSARAGVFQITEPFSTEVAAYGIYDTSSRKKEIRVTVHTVFALE